MRLLRGVQPVLKVTLLFLLALFAMLALTLFHPRSAHAEGFLSKTVRCLLQTVKLERCQPNEVTPQSQAPSAQTSPQQETPRQSSPGKQGVSGLEPSSGGGQTAPVQGAPLDLPSTVPPTAPTIKPFPEGDQLGVNHVNPSDYIAYFNKYSKYAVSANETNADDMAVVQASTEGWKVMGVAWYWWLLGLGALAGGIFLTKRIFFSKNSVLSNRS